MKGIETENTSTPLFQASLRVRVYMEKRSSDLKKAFLEAGIHIEVNSPPQF